MDIRNVTGYLVSHGLGLGTKIVVATQDEMVSEIGYLSVETDMRTGDTLVVIHPHYDEQLDTEAHPAFEGEPK